MNQGELERKIKAVGTKLNRSKLVDNCLKAMKEHGRYQTHTHSDRTDVEADYSDDVVSISYSCGGYAPGNLKVSSGNEIVLHTKDRASDDKDENGIPYPEAGLHYVHKYHSGEWEEHIKQLARMTKEQIYERNHPSPPNPKPVPKERVVSESVLRDLNGRYPGVLG